MNVAITPRARDFVKDRGGVVYVRSHAHRCCRGPIVLLDTTTAPPSDAADFVPVEIGDIVVEYRGNEEARPHELAIDIRGLVRRHLVSYWDGCAYKP